jgi:hypothetical protein
LTKIPDNLFQYMYMYKAWIRLSSHNLFIETGRYTGIVRNERKCILCNLNVLEDEFHFVLQCTKYNDLSKKYIKKYYWSRPSNWFSYCQWKTGKKFIHLACKARNNLVWLTCVIYNFLTYLCYFLICHIYMLYTHVIIACHIVYWWTVMFKVNKEFEFE